jgi:hypothetical protein
LTATGAGLRPWYSPAVLARCAFIALAVAGRALLWAPFWIVAGIWVTMYALVTISMIATIVAAVVVLLWDQVTGQRLELGTVTAVLMPLIALVGAALAYAFGPVGPLRAAPGADREIHTRAEPIEAVRAWIVDVEPGTTSGDRLGTPILRSLNLHSWASAESTARCRYLDDSDDFDEDEEDHVAPELDCTCGIYAVKQESAIPGPSTWGWWVSGRLWLSGKVIETERGYRAERARIAGPLALHRSPELVGSAVADGSAVDRFGIREGGVDVAGRAIAARLELRYGVTVTWEGEGR